MIGGSAIVAINNMRDASGIGVAVVAVVAWLAVCWLLWVVIADWWRSRKERRRDRSR